MKKIELIKHKYELQKAAYFAKLQPIDTNKLHTCLLCGAKNLINIDAHLAQHNEEPPKEYNYVLPYSFRSVNGKIRSGAKFIKLLIEYQSGRCCNSVYNALNLSDWQKLQDVNGVTVRWSKQKKQFTRRWLLFIAFALLIFI